VSSEKLVKLTVLIPEDLHKKLKIKAIMEGKSISEVIREYINVYVKDIEPQRMVKNKAKKR